MEFFVNMHSKKIIFEANEFQFHCMSPNASEYIRTTQDEAFRMTNELFVIARRQKATAKGPEFSTFCTKAQSFKLKK